MTCVKGNLLSVMVVSLCLLLGDPLSICHCTFYCYGTILLTDWLKNNKIMYKIMTDYIFEAWFFQNMFVVDCWISKPRKPAVQLFRVRLVSPSAWYSYTRTTRYSGSRHGYWTTWTNSLPISKTKLADLRTMVATGAALDASPTRWGSLMQ